MKRFIAGMITCIVMISTGCMLSVFEIKDYRVVNAYSEIADEVQTYETTVDKENELRIILDTYVDIQYDIDESMGSKVEFDVSQNLEYKYSNNRLKIKDYRWYDLPFGEYINTFMDGLKDKKLYYYDEYRIHDDEIIIRCSSKAKEYIRVTED